MKKAIVTVGWAMIAAIVILLTAQTINNLIHGEAHHGVYNRVDKTKRK